MATNASESIAPESNHAASPQIDDPETQPSLHVGPTGVVHRGAGTSRSARTAEGWTPTDRWAWAYALPVSGIARAVAGCIAYHANNKTGLAWPGIGKIVTETGFKRTAVIAAIQELERGGHLPVRREKVDGKNLANRYQLPPMGSPPRGPVEVGGSAPDEPPSAPDGLGGSPLDGPESVSSESVHESVKAAAASTHDRTEVQPDEHNPPTRHTCPTCGNTWPARYGTTCFQCPQPTAAQLRRQKQKKDDLESERPLPPARPDPAPLTPETRNQLETDAIENGFHKLDDGSWTKSAPSPQPTPPVEPTATPEQARKHINDMLDTIRNARAPLPRRRPDGRTTA